MNKPLWMEAAAMSARLHRGQFRRDRTTPYAVHPFRVALVVRTVFSCDDDDALAIALLHDVIEDTPADYDDLIERFGEEVAAGVAALTKDMRLPEDPREAVHDAQIAAAGWRAKLVKLADTLDNLLDAERPTTSDIDKCRRAIAVAEVDPAPPLAAAIEKTREILAAVGHPTSG